MTRDQLLNRYSVEARILDTALAARGGGYTAPNYSSAVTFRHRCYTFMKAYREADTTPSRYDALALRMLPKKSLVKDLEAPITLRIDVQTQEGEFVPDNPLPEGVDFTPVQEDPIDGTLDAAIELRKKLGL